MWGLVTGTGFHEVVYSLERVYRTGLLTRVLGKESLKESQWPANKTEGTEKNKRIDKRQGDK